MKHFFIGFFISRNIVDSNVSFFWQVYPGIWLSKQFDNIGECSVVALIVMIIKNLLTLIIGEFKDISLVSLSWLIDKLIFSLLLELFLEFAIRQLCLLEPNLSS